jgi:hypothetical protein
LIFGHTEARIAHHLIDETVRIDRVRERLLCSQWGLALEIEQANFAGNTKAQFAAETLARQVRHSLGRRQSSRESCCSPVDVGLAAKQHRSCRMIERKNS